MVRQNPCMKATPRERTIHSLCYFEYCGNNSFAALVQMLRPSGRSCTNDTLIVRCSVARHVVLQDTIRRQKLVT